MKNLNSSKNPISALFVFPKLVEKRFLVGIAVVLVVATLVLLFQTTKVTTFMFGKPSLEEEGGRVNILLLGMAGGKHDGATLTDTMMVASYDLKTSQVALISLPRDLWLKKHQTKINTLYQMGLKNRRGLDFAEREIGEILGISIPYGVRVDFSGFVKAVDLLGGVEVMVENPFEDYQYPVEGKQNDTCGYKEEEKEMDGEQSMEWGVKSGKLKVLLDPHGKIATAAAEPGKEIVYTEKEILAFFPCRFEYLKFDQGVTRMNGEAALKFVRSRSGTNKEGSDFARSKRQQLVLGAFREKVLSVQTLLDPKKMVELLQTFGQNVETDIPQPQYLRFIKLVKDLKGVKSYVINGLGEDSLLINPPPAQYGAWVLVPKDDSFSQIRDWIKAVLEEKVEFVGSDGD